MCAAPEKNRSSLAALQEPISFLCERAREKDCTAWRLLVAGSPGNFVSGVSREEYFLRRPMHSRVGKALRACGPPLMRCKKKRKQSQQECNNFWLAVPLFLLRKSKDVTRCEKEQDAGLKWNVTHMTVRDNFCQAFGNPISMASASVSRTGQLKTGLRRCDTGCDKVKEIFTMPRRC